MWTRAALASAADGFLTRLLSSSAESQDSGYLYFCFRWLLIRFKRELSFQDVLRLWEVGPGVGFEEQTRVQPVLINPNSFPHLSSSGDVDGSSLSELPPAGLLRHPGLGEAEDHGGELWFQRDPEGKVQSADGDVPLVSLTLASPWLQHINELSMKLDIEAILQKAEGICLQIQNCKVPSLSLVLRGFQLFFSTPDFSSSLPSSGRASPHQNHPGL